MAQPKNLYPMTQPLTDAIRDAGLTPCLFVCVTCKNHGEMRIAVAEKVGQMSALRRVRALSRYGGGRNKPDAALLGESWALPADFELIYNRPRR